MTRYDPATTALVLIDLQKGIAGAMRAPYSADAVVAKAKTLAAQFRAAGAPVCLVHVAWNTAYSDAPKGLSDAAMALPEGGLPESWSEFVEGLAQPNDIIVQKRNWGAFYGTDLDLQLRRRGIKTIILAGIATNFGVESTARDAWERNYNVVIVEDACTTNSAELHRLAIEFIFPRISRVVQSDQITLT
jgi:nicotinamidase-related amidase